MKSAGKTKNDEAKLIGLWLLFGFVILCVLLHFFYNQEILEFLASTPALKLEKPADAYFYSETGAYKKPVILSLLALATVLAAYASWVKNCVKKPVVRVISLFSKLLVLFYVVLTFLAMLLSSGFGGMVG